MTPLSWTARRRGDVYCAPACGFGCKWTAYETAVENASALAAQLGEGWEPRVWENVGWHYSAQTTDRRIKVHPGGHDADGTVVSYTAFVSAEPSSGGRWVARGSTPRGAVEAAALDVYAELDGLQEVVHVMGRLREHGYAVELRS